MAVESGVYWQERWVEDEDFFVAYRDLTPDASWLKDAKKGSLGGVTFPLHTST